MFVIHHASSLRDLCPQGQGQDPKVICPDVTQEYFLKET